MTAYHQRSPLAPALNIYHILKQMTGFHLLLFVPSPVLEVSPLECSHSGSVYVLYLVLLSQVSD